MLHSVKNRNASASSGHFEALFRNAKMGILIMGSDGKITAVNPLILKTFGYTEQDLLGRNIETLMPPRFRKKHVLFRQQYLQEPKNCQSCMSADVLAVKKDGTEFKVEIHLINYNENGEKSVIAFLNLKGTNGQSKGNYLDKFFDPDKKRNSKQKGKSGNLKLADEILEEATSFQKAILDNAGAMIIATDEHGKIKLFNPEASLNIGYLASEVINKATPLLFHDKSEVALKRKELSKQFAKSFDNDFEALVEKSRKNIHEEEQYTYIRKNGTRFPVSLTITAIRNSVGMITGFMGVAIDISERKKAEEKLRSALEKERELSELKTRFVSMASHEFRTPLSTVLTSAYLIRKYTGTDEQPNREKHVNRIISSVTMLTDILNDFMSLGKIEEGRIQVRPSHFNIHELVNNVISEMKEALKKDQAIRYLHEGKTDVYLDPSLLKHIVMNLLSNASKFSQENSVIEVRTVGGVKNSLFSVKDHGIGISRDDQKHLMERFFRGANAGNIQGTGLGLHIVSKYAELMNGTVTCKSELEKGTEFIINFTNKTS